MKNVIILFSLFLFATGCSTVTKKFSLIVDPPDAEIRVIPGGKQPEQIYRSPAVIAVSIPADPVKAAESRIEIKRETYKTRTIRLDSAGEGLMKIVMDKLVLYRPKFRLLQPVLSDVLGYRDKIVSISVVPGNRAFELKIENLTQKPLTILWDKAEYMDYRNRAHPLMHGGIRPQDRNDTVPPQVIPPAGSLQQSIFPKSAVRYSQAMKDYITNPLLPLDSENALSLKDKTFTLFLPIEMDRGIIPDYLFKFQIVDLIKE
jgi:hypothetical protein